MHTVRNWVVGLLVIMAAPLSAQSAGGRWAEAKCQSDLKPGHYLVNSGLLYLKNASN